jgi:hypothetical protein
LKDGFDVINEVFNWIITNTNIMSLLNNPISNTELNSKIRRRDQSPDSFSQDDLDFMAIYIPHVQETHNFMADKGFFFIDLYCAEQYNAEQLFKAIKVLIYEKTNREYKIRAFEVPCDIATIYKYRMIVSCLIGS